MKITNSLKPFISAQTAAQPVAAKPLPRITAAEAANVEVFDMSSGTEQLITGVALLHSNDPVLARARDNAIVVDRFIREKLGRNGWDDKGSPLRIVVHAPNNNNSAVAEWDENSQRIYLSDGDGEMFGPMGDSLDVIAHEAMHGVIRSHFNVRYEGQQGGIDESWADVFGVLVDDKNMRIGEDSFTPGIDGDEIRDLRNPRYGHVEQLPKEQTLGVHDLSGIPSLAAVRVADAIGKEQMGSIWYNALVGHLSTNAGYSGAARATIDAAVELHGFESKEVQAVRDAWRSVGVDARWSMSRSKAEVS